MSTRLLQWYFWHQITAPIIICCGPSDRMFQKPGGLLSFFFLFFLPSPDRCSSSGTCPELLAFWRNRKACCIYGQPAVVTEVNFFFIIKGKGKKTKQRSSGKPTLRSALPVLPAATEVAATEENQEVFRGQLSVEAPN